MKTPNLLTVPKDSPTRKERLEAFKTDNGIQTHDAGKDWGRGSGRWCAVLFDVAWDHFGCYCEGDRSFFGLIAGACRLVDEAGLSGYGDSELSAVREVCRLNKIPCPL